MPSSTSCALSFLCLTLLLLVRAQDVRQRTFESVGIECCPQVSRARIRDPVITCDIQRKYMFHDCPIEAYILTTATFRYCVDPNAKWLPERLEILKRKGIVCRVLGRG